MGSGGGWGVGGLLCPYESQEGDRKELGPICWRWLLIPSSLKRVTAVAFQHHDDVS